MSSYDDEAERPLLRNHQHQDSPSIKDPKALSQQPDKLRALARIVGCCVSAAAAGWHDGCIGALIPYLQVYYGGVTDEKVALIFIGSFTGYTLASLLNVTFTTHLGLRRLIVLGAIVQGLASAVMALHPPFLAITICYGIAGFGIAIQDAQYNTYLAPLPGSSTKLGIVHAMYGFGALVSPIVATLFMQARIQPPLFYFTNVALCFVTTAVLLTGFGFNNSKFLDHQDDDSADSDESIASLRTVVKSRVVWTALVFISLYTGAETTQAGWAVTFLMRERNGGSKSGYASAAFYGGLTSGRIVLLPLTAYLTENRAISLYAIIALGMQILIGVSPSFIINLLAIGICGLVMGPVYPVTVSIITKATPRGYHPGALSLLACVAQSGSALFPFVVGLLAESYSAGIKVLQPILGMLFIAMFVLWQLVPAPKVKSRNPSIAPKPASLDDSVET
jgi:fucose permease